MAFVGIAYISERQIVEVIRKLSQFLESEIADSQMLELAHGYKFTKQLSVEQNLPSTLEQPTQNYEKKLPAFLRRIGVRRRMLPGRTATRYRRRQR